MSPQRNSLILGHMNEQQFREFLEKRPHLRDKIEGLIEASSPAHLLSDAKQRGLKYTEEQIEAIASMLRTQSATLLSMTETGAMTEDEARAHRIKKLPDDFPR
jgi:hypothetical protein